MITIVPVSTPDKKLLNKEEIEAAVAIIGVINQWFGDVSLGIGAANLEVIKFPNLGNALFSPKSLNPGFPCDRIYISMDKFTRWNQFIFQASHEFTHCVIHRLNSNENQKALWIEETICEAMSLVFLQIFANSWNNCVLSQHNLTYSVAIQNYLNNQLNETGTSKLEKCCGLEELQEINQYSADHREYRSNEMHKLFFLIKDSEDVNALVHYRDYVEPNTILLDTDKYRAAYPDLESVRYLCELQENAISKR